MKIKNIFILAVLALGINFSISGKRYSGGDISLLPVYEEAGAKYKDQNGKAINDLLPYLHEEGMNAMRVRLFVNPSDFVGNDPNACQDLPFIIPLCKRIVENGFDLMLDFHYSDTWADPGAQWIPKAWEGLNEAELIQVIYDYTKDTLETLKAEGIIPSFIQTGNEISYGMLWSSYGAPASEQHKTFMGNNANWERLGKLLNSAIKACNEVCPEAKIILHTERVAQVNVQNNFYNKMKELNVKYDIIGLSYYPYFHGKMNVLNNALTSLETNFPDKEIMIVETGFPYKWEVPGTTEKVDYEYSATGQDAFARELVDTLLAHENVNGLFWWWLEYNAFGTNLSGWYNAPLFDSLTGMATPALKTIAGYASDEGGVNELWNENFVRDDNWYDLSGRKISKPNSPGVFINKGKAVILK